MTTEEIKKAMEDAGRADKYDAQAKLFCEHTGTKIEARYLKTAPHFHDDKEARDVYEVRMTRGNRSHVFTFGNSISDTEERIARVFKYQNDPGMVKAVRENGGKPLAGEWLKVKGFKQWETAHKGWLDVSDPDAGDRPNAYSILAAMTKYAPADNVDDFAAEFGYTKISVALSVYEAVKKEFAALEKMYSDEELELMACIW